MESISWLMDAMLGARWLHWLCPQASACICHPSYGAHCVYSPSPAVRSKLEGNCQSWRESTFNLEEAIHGGLFPVNAMDKEDKADRPQSMQARSEAKHTMWSFQWTVWFAPFPTLCLAIGHTIVQQLASHIPISKSHQHWGLHKICIAWQGLLKVYPGQILLSLINLTHFKTVAAHFQVVFEVSTLITFTEHHSCFTCKNVNTPL